MSESAYRPPASDVGSGEDDGGRYYVVSPRKFLVMSIVTVNAYFLYWFYRNFKRMKDGGGEDIWPIPRALFHIFFTHFLTRDVDAQLREKGQQLAWSPESTATAYVVLTIGSNVLDRMSTREFGSPVTDLLAFLIVPVVAWSLLPAQRAINLASGDPEGRSNERFTLANMAWMAFFGLIWAAALVGLWAMLFAPEWLAE